MQKPGECKRTWHFERHNNPWNGLTSDAAAEEATYTVQARKKPTGSNRISQPQAVPSGDFVLFRAEKDKAVVVNARYFGNLTRQNVTGRPLRNNGVIGTATKTALSLFKPEEILGLLLDLQIIITYAHMESTVCLIQSSEKDEVYEAQLTGEHVYFTNARNVSTFSFRFELNRRTGQMRVE